MPQRNSARVKPHDEGAIIAARRGDAKTRGQNDARRVLVVELGGVPLQLVGGASPTWLARPGVLGCREGGQNEVASAGEGSGCAWATFSRACLLRPAAASIPRRPAPALRPGCQAPGHKRRPNRRGRLEFSRPDRSPRGRLQSSWERHGPAALIARRGRATNQLVWRPSSGHLP